MNRRQVLQPIAVWLLLLFSILFYVPDAGAQAENGALKFLAELRYDLYGHSGSQLNTQGSAYIEPGDGLRVMEGGTNLIVNPSFELGSDAWHIQNNASISVYEGDSFAGDKSLLLYAPGPNDGVYITDADGGIDLGFTSSKSPHAFSVYAKSATAQPQLITLSMSSDNEAVLVTDSFTVSAEWERYEVTLPRTMLTSTVRASIYADPGCDEATVLLDAVMLDGRQYASPYVDGDCVACSWMATPHASASERIAGSATISGAEIGLDFSKPFWFALDVTMGFDRFDIFSNGPGTGTKDFVNIGKGNGDGTGFENNEGIILHYLSYGRQKRLRFEKTNGKGVAGDFDVPYFESGDPLRVVCSYDPARGMEIWYSIAGSPIQHELDSSDAAKSQSLISPDWIMSVSDSKIFEKYGDYQSNSLHRNLIVTQGSITEETATAYISDPDAYVRGINGAVCDKPKLELGYHDASWSSFSDYQSGLLTVEYLLENNSSIMASNLKIIGATGSNGVFMASPLPAAVDEMAPYGSQVILLKYQVPPGVRDFKAVLFITGEDACGFSYDYPGPYYGN